MDEDQKNNSRFSFIQKNKFNWFSSLKRKSSKKQNNNSSLKLNDTTTKDDGAQNDFLITHNNNNNNNNVENNNSIESNNSVENLRNKNIFQRIKFKMDFKFNNASGIRNSNTQNNDNEIDDMIRNQKNDSEENTFTHNYCNKIAKKWLEQTAGPNMIMYKTCMEMINHVWYWGKISKQNAENKLTNKPNGSFLVRDSESGGSQFTLSFRINNCTFHYRLKHYDNYWHFYELQYESIVELIEDIQFKSADSSFICFVKTNIMAPPIPVFLRYPISRYIEIPKLQELCKRSLIQYLPETNASDKIEKLPIPVKLQEFLMEKNTFMF